MVVATTRETKWVEKEAEKRDLFNLIFGAKF